MVRKKLGRGHKNRCRFCTKEGCPRPAFVDYKDVQGLKKLCTSQGKLFSRKRSGNCATFQRAVATALKRARFMALLAYVFFFNDTATTETYTLSLHDALPNHDV